MKLKNGFITHFSKGENILVPVGNAEFSGIVKGNDTFGEILKLLESETTEEDIINKMTQLFDAPEETIGKDVRRVLDSLRSIGAIEE